MRYTFFLTATGPGTGLTSTCLGVVRALDQIGINVGFCKPISQQIHTHDENPSQTLIKATLGIEPSEPLTLSYAQKQLALGLSDHLMEEIISITQKDGKHADVLIVEGLLPLTDATYISELNRNMAKALDADIIVVAAQNKDDLTQLNERIKMTASLFGGIQETRPMGLIFNKVGAPRPSHTHLVIKEDTVTPKDSRSITEKDALTTLPLFKDDSFHCIGSIPWNPSLLAPRTIDIAKHLNATLIHRGNIKERRVSCITICARTMPNMLQTLKANTLIVTPGDREDIFMAVCMAALNGVPLAGILLTGDLKPRKSIIDLCRTSFDTGLPILSCQQNTLDSAYILNNLNTEVPADDLIRMEKVISEVAQAIDASWLAKRAQVNQEKRLSPPAFRYLLVSRAQQAAKKIVLPEGNEPRTIKAAAQCVEKNIANCVLLGNPEEIYRIAQTQNINIPDNLTIINPEKVRHRYVKPMVALRQHKGLTEPMAEAQLEDPVVLATMMLATNEVDGLVAGAVNTTANTVRPALQLIKTHPESKIVSSVFFMLLPNQAVVYGDCAINPDPSAQELADIAIQSGDSAKAFGIEPKIAMISYSTGQSGSGNDVEKVRQATQIAQAKRPDLKIDGPLQYDAASTPSVAKNKAPDSQVAGQATVYVFPDLNTGNTTYKAVQRSANVISIGPMLQGLRKPVNDLSRGALVEDIVYTIALTAIQAQQMT